MGINQSTSPLVRYEPISFTHLLNIKYSVKKAKLVNMLVSVRHGGGVIFPKGKDNHSIESVRYKYSISESI